MGRWYRAYPGLVTNAKLGEVALVAGCSRAVAIAAWHATLESCANVADGGKFDTTPRRVAAILGETVEQLEAVFAAFAALGMVAEGAVCSWSRRQFEGDSSTERSRRHRAKSRNADETRGNGDETLHERRTTAAQHPQNTDTESEANASAPPGDSAEPAASGSGLPSPVWIEGVAAMLAMGANERQARANIGRWLSTASGDAERVLGAIRRAREMGTRDPVPLVTRILSPSSTRAGKPERTALHVLRDLSSQLAHVDDDRDAHVPALHRRGSA